MNVEQLIERYIGCLERENERLRKDAKESQENAVTIKNLEKIREEYEKALEDIDKRDTILWKLGLAASSDDSDKKAIIIELGKAVSNMQETSPVSDVDAIVEEIYTKFS